ncbi:MAG: nitrite/sulfite reductase [Helicobacteraceae bacterium]|jgi:ferredoxin-nitrite reductase|nr:nitrite/sulfite reductase [Helicobacteraceae bacterium]
MQESERKLNKRERYKAQMRPYDYLPEFETLDFESLGEGDRYYLQDFGIFNAEFAEEEFTLRLRLPAGRLGAGQLQELAQILTEHDLHIILTARAGLQIFGLEAENILGVWKQVNAMGLSTWQSFGDNVRNIVSDVYDGVGQYNMVEAYPIVMQMQEHILKVPRYVGMLPRRISVGISGNSANVTSMFANDLYFALAEKEGLFGFNVYMGGKNTEVARSADIFLLPDEVIGFFAAFVEAFYKHGSRASRAKTRLFYLLEEIGMDGFKKHLASEYGKPFTSGGKLQFEKARFETYETLKDGTLSFCYETDFGRVDAKELTKIAVFAAEQKAEIRFGIDQNIYLLGLKEKCDALSSPKLSNTILACAGSEYCPFSFWNIKDETAYLPLEKIHEHRIEVGFSGCAKGCGRHRHTDIGLIGLKTNSFGATEGGARVFIGAEHTEGLSAGRTLFPMVPLEHLHAVLSLIIALYEESGCSDFEAYSTQTLNTFSEEFLALWFLANLQTHQLLKLLPNENLPTAQKGFEYEKRLLEKYFEGLDFLDLIEDDFSEALTVLSRELWTIKGEDPHYKPPIERHVCR